MSEKIILRDEELGDLVAFAYDASDFVYEAETGNEACRKFLEEFEMVEPEQGKFLGDPKEDFYQGVTHINVFKRKLDGKLFGLPYFHMGGKYGEPYPEAEEVDGGYFYVLREVESFYMLGYVVKEDGE